MENVKGKAEPELQGHAETLSKKALNRNFSNRRYFTQYRNSQEIRNLHKFDNRKQIYSSQNKIDQNSSAQLSKCNSKKQSLSPSPIFDTNSGEQMGSSLPVSKMVVRNTFTSTTGYDKPPRYNIRRPKS